MLIRNIPRPERRDSGKIGAEFDPLRRQTLRIGWFLLAIHDAQRLILVIFATFVCIGIARAQIHVQQARIGCLDIQNTGNLTSLVQSPDAGGIQRGRAGDRRCFGRFHGNLAFSQVDSNVKGGTR